MANLPFEPNDVLTVRVRNAQRKIIAPTDIKKGAKTKRSQCFRRNVFQSRKPKAKKKNMELSVEK